MTISASDRSRRHGLLLNYTGDGKGKTTAALGCAVRALGWDWKVEFIQFCKHMTDTGENRFVNMLHPNLKLYTMGAGFSWCSKASLEEHIRRARGAWEFSAATISEGNADLVVLDELNSLLANELLPLDNVLEVLKSRPKWMHVIITGRSAPARLRACCDMVSEIISEKHHFDLGICAQPGIEY